MFNAAQYYREQAAKRYCPVCEHELELADRVWLDKYDCVCACEYCCNPSTAHAVWEDLMTG